MERAGRHPSWMDREKLYGGLSTSLLKFVRHLILHLLLQSGVYSALRSSTFKTLCGKIGYQLENRVNLQERVGNTALCQTNHALTQSFDSFLPVSTSCTIINTDGGKQNDMLWKRLLSIVTRTTRTTQAHHSLRKRRSMIYLSSILIFADVTNLPWTTT